MKTREKPAFERAMLACVDFETNVCPGDPFFPSPAVNAAARASDNYVTVCQYVLQKLRLPSRLTSVC